MVKVFIDSCVLADDLILQNVLKVIINNFDTHDAYLTSQAIHSKCKYFITTDQLLRKRMRKSTVLIPNSPNTFYLLFKR